MEVGVRLTNAGSKATPENIRAVARWAEQMGYHSVWVSNHVVLPEQVESYYPYRANGRWDYPSDTNYLDPLLSLAWGAAIAPSLKLGTSMLIGPLYNPVTLAKQIATLDYLTGGRVILGIGAGWMEEEFKLVGMPFHDRGRRVVEMVELMRALWSGETVDFHGQFWQVSGCRMRPRPVQAQVPVIWGGHSDAAIRRVARAGGGWNPSKISLQQLAEGLQKLRRYCEECNRDPDALLIISRPDGAYEVTSETCGYLAELGVDHLIVETPIKQEDPELKFVREEMEQVAAVCGLQSRA